MFGVPFGAGVYVNYLFFAVWGWDAWRWRTTRRPLHGRTGWWVRIFYFIIIVNAAVVFAAGPRRILGILVTLLLVTASMRAQRKAALTASTMSCMS